MTATAPFRVTVTWGHLGDPDTRPPTIGEALAAKLGREPTNAEAAADVRRILAESHCERATAGKLPYQRKGRGR